MCTNAGGDAFFLGSIRRTAQDGPTVATLPGGRDAAEVTEACVSALQAPAGGSTGINGLSIASHLNAGHR